MMKWLYIFRDTQTQNVLGFVLLEIEYNKPLTSS
jgi:hypothetical protein